MRYRKTVEVEARQVPPLTPGFHEFDPLTLEELAEWCGGQKFINHTGAYIVVPTIQGEMRAWPGDWIVQGVQGEFYPVKPEIFASSYQPVPEAGTSPELAARHLAQARSLLTEFRREDDAFIAYGGAMPNYSQWAARLANRLSDLIAIFEQEQS